MSDLHLVNIVLCGCWFSGTELDDVKKLLKGRSCSVSPTRSSNASISQPPSKKATVETQTISVASVATQSGTYPLWSNTCFCVYILCMHRHAVSPPPSLGDIWIKVVSVCGAGVLRYIHRISALSIWFPAR